jgi:hypothetical protein
MPVRSAITLLVVTAAAGQALFSPDLRALARQIPAAPAAPAQPATPAPAAKLEFASDAGLILSPIKPERTAAFEEVIARVRETLIRSADPVRKQQAAGWKIYRAKEPYQNTTLYVSVMDPAVKGAEYGVFRLLQEGLGEAPARELFEKFRDAHAGGQHVLPLTPVAKPAG